MPLQLNVTSQTTLQDLDAFARLAGDDAKIRGKVEKDGSVTLYASHKKSGSFDWLSRLFGGQSRASKQEVAQQAIATILRNSSSLGTEKHDRLMGNVWSGVPGGRGHEIRTEGLQKIVGDSTPLLKDTVEFGGKTYAREKALGSDGNGEVDLYRSEDGEAIVLKRPKVPTGTPPRDPQELEGYLSRLSESRQEANQALRDEIALHRHIQESGEHPNILPLLGELTGPLGEPILVLPLAPKGDAFGLGNKLCGAREDGRVDTRQGELMGLTMLRDVGESLDHLHNRAGVLHLDMKPENYLVDGQGRLRLMDFGTSKSGLNHDLSQHPVDSDRFLPPENLIAKRLKIVGDPALQTRLTDVRREIYKAEHNRPGAPSPERLTELRKEERELLSDIRKAKQSLTIPVNPQSDSWTLGIMAYRLLVDTRPNSVSPFFRETDPNNAIEGDRIESFGKGAKPVLEQVLEWYPDDEGLRTRIESLTPEVRDLVNGLLHPDPKQRMSVEQTLSHPLLQQEGVGGEGVRQSLLDL